jgi:hypothetical protein
MAGLTRLELATFRVTGERSNQTELQPLDSTACAVGDGKKFQFLANPLKK